MIVSLFLKSEACRLMILGFRIGAPNHAAVMIYERVVACN